MGKRKFKGRPLRNEKDREQMNNPFPPEPDYESRRTHLWLDAQLQKAEGLAVAVLEWWSIGFEGDPPEYVLNAADYLCFPRNQDIITAFREWKEKRLTSSQDDVK